MKKWMKLAAVCTALCLCSSCSYTKWERIFGEKPSEPTGTESKTTTMQETATETEAATESETKPQQEQAAQNPHAYVPIGVVFSATDVTGEKWKNGSSILSGVANAAENGIFYLDEDSFWYFSLAMPAPYYYAGKRMDNGDGTLLLQYETAAIVQERELIAAEGEKDEQDLQYANENGMVLSVCSEESVPIRMPLPLFQRKSPDGDRMASLCESRNAVSVQEKSGFLVTEQASYLMQDGGTAEQFQLNHMLTPTERNTSYSLTFSENHICYVNGQDAIGSWSLYDEHLVLLYDNTEQQEYLCWFYVDFETSEVDLPLYMQQDALLELCESVSDSLNE